MTNLSELKHTVTIEGILAECGTHLTKGRCRCPLHGGNNPTSFSVRDGYFHCFSCGVSGDVISLTQRLYDTDFIGAVDYLARKAGISRTDCSRLHRKIDMSSPDPTPRPEGEECEVLQKLIRLWTMLFRYLQRDLSDGRTTLSQYYAKVQWIEYQLSKLDELSVLENHEGNMRRREKWAKATSTKKPERNSA